MTEQRARARRPGPALVIWTSIVLFAVLFAVLTYQLSASRPPAPRPILVRHVIKRRVVTSIVPTPGRSTIASSGQVTGSAPLPAPAPVTTSAS